MAFLDRGGRSAEAEAVVDSELSVLSREAFDQLAATNPKLATRVFEQLSIAIAQRLRVTDEELRVLEER
jgi:CRP-like cAMP-binding protein